VAAHADVCLVGNHDLGVRDAIDISEFSPDAEEAALWTREILDPGNADFLDSLEPSAVLPSAALYHGSPRDPIWEYVLSEETAAAAIGDSPRELVLVGHSHVALAISSLDERLDGGLAPDGTAVELGSGERWLLNPGSVGQPRDGDPRAAWLLLDLELRRAAFRRETYDVAATQAEILDAGLPESLALRLAEGV
jgi:diadenosine tetraphosphatase ApaH/serine/threonine PP2A family protein phosphatase